MLISVDLIRGTAALQRVCGGLLSQLMQHRASPKHSFAENAVRVQCDSSFSIVSSPKDEGFDVSLLITLETFLRFRHLVNMLTAAPGACVATRMTGSTTLMNAAVPSTNAGTQTSFTATTRSTAIPFVAAPLTSKQRGDAPPLTGRYDVR